MKFSENWLREWVNPEIDSDTLCEQLTMAGLEVDGIEGAAEAFSGVVVAQVVEAKQHPDADKLKVCVVSNGTSTVEIVCGAPNARTGIKVACAEVGAVLPGNFKIKKAKLRGVVSMGMLCSESELGLSDESDGIMELPEDAPIGTDFREYLSLDDQCIDVDLTPNRGDCLGIRGIAREVAVLNKTTVTAPQIDSVAATIDDTLPIELQATEACPRYVGRIIRNINPQAKTPLWMVEKLRRSGIRAIFPLVDITNFVLLELGHPMHAFDLREIQGGIRVRFPEADEKLVLLDGREVELSKDTLLIADQQRPLALAGIMGGEHSGIADDTADVFLESAWFNPLAIVGKARLYGLHTDASHRYERGVDPQLQVKAIERASQLILSICGGEAGPVMDEKAADQLPVANTVTLRRSRVTRLLGVTLEDDVIEDILNRLELTTEATEEGWQVTSPSHRFDIEIEADLIEEIARIYGYNNMPAIKCQGEMSMTAKPESQLQLNRFKQLMADRGYQEAITYSFVDPTLQKLLFPDIKSLSLLNPISTDMGEMRVSLWPGLIQALQRNQSFREQRIRLFETGLRFLPTDGDSEENDIDQQLTISGLIAGSREPLNWEGNQTAIDFYDIKADVEALCGVSAAEAEFSVEKAEISALHPGQSAKLLRNGENVGYFGAIHPGISKKLKLSGPVYLFEITVSGIDSANIPEYQEWSRFPSSTRDLAVIIDEDVSANELLEAVNEAGGKRLVNARIFDIYRGKGVDFGRKSIALGLTFGDFSHTLKDTEVSNMVDKIINRLSERFSATLRD
ncbi:MAG: phenylalanine--tRNA ligase subunit beta [Gammaproteobacteria bacterium]|nr:MAG: phenylalanine--tRNA ligase subunit beta [Gammaproteobacteria bacterium]